MKIAGKLFCSKCGWRYAAPKQRYCRECHNEWMRENRKPLDDWQRKHSNARAYLHSYVKRGYVIKKPCLICAEIKVEAHHEDYDRPLHIVWLCRGHHQMVTNNDLNILPRYVIDGRMLIKAEEMTW